MKEKIAIIGLGYVGLPLAVAFAKYYEVIGYDINSKRVSELNDGCDTTFEVDNKKLQETNNIYFTTDLNDIKSCNIYIVTVPTPIDSDKKPDLTPLKYASQSVGKVISKDDIVIYESTVYPGVTEDYCIPFIEKESGLIFNSDFFAGYSPERINPGDKDRDVTTILKVTSGSTDDIADKVDCLYKKIITAGTYKATSIKVAESAKLIENVQRDVNIALINELHQIFSRLNINTIDVINAASTKWNFMKLYPGLVGGHCIGVDPYYLLHKAENSGYVPDLIRSAREVNDHMSDFVVSQFIRTMLKEKIEICNLRVLILGFSFKENCPDIRNTRVYDLYTKLIDLGLSVEIYDPVVDQHEVYNEYGLKVRKDYDFNYDVAFLAVPHSSIINEIEFIRSSSNNKFVFDYKNN